MQVVQFLVGTDGVHVSVNAVAGLGLEGAQFHALPFGKRMNDLGTTLLDVLDGENNGALNAVQIIVDASSRKNEKRRSDTLELQVEGKIALEGFLRLAYRPPLYF